MTFDLKAEKQAMLESIRKAGGAALVDTYDQAPEQNLPGLDFVNPDDPKEKYDNLSAYHQTVLHDNNADMPFSSDLFQNGEVSDALAGRQTAEDKDKEAERYINDFVRKIMESLNKDTRGHYFYDNPPPESIRDAFLFESDDDLEDLLAQALREGASDYIKNNRAKWAKYFPQRQLVPDPSDVKSQAQAEKVLAKKAQRTEQVNRSFDIDAAMASRSQSYSAEPIQHPFQKAQMTNGRFGNRREMSNHAIDKAIYDWFRSGDVNNWSKDQLGLANNLYNYYSSANTHQDVPGNLVNAYQELVGSKKKASDDPTTDQLMEENDESARYAQQNYGQPAEARLDQPDARDSSS